MSQLVLSETVIVWIEDCSLLLHGIKHSKIGAPEVKADLRSLSLSDVRFKAF